MTETKQPDITPAGSRRYTAREWLERTLPEGGEWQLEDFPHGAMFFWPDSREAVFGVVFTKQGSIVCGAGRGKKFKDDTIIPRSTAIERMVAAIEAGEAVQAGGVPIVTKAGTVCMVSEKRAEIIGKKLSEGEANEYMARAQAMAGDQSGERTEMVESKASDQPASVADRIIAGLERILAELRGGGE